MRLEPRALLVVVSVLGVIAGCGVVQAPDATVTAVEDGPALWPEIEPFETGSLRVSDLHELYYELSGNPEGTPVLVLHGGPGGSSSPVMRRFCDPDRYLIVLHDQRGAGRSRPAGDLEDNTTWTLVEDVERLRRHLGLGRVVLFGGSWGTTLALAYAERYPDHVGGLVLRGVFTATRAEVDHFYHGGAALFFPDLYQQLLSELPEPDRRPLPQYLAELLATTSGDEQRRYCRAWARYEGGMVWLDPTDAQRAHLEALLERNDVCTFARFENHYMANGCFLEEGQLLADLDRLAGIPTFIVQGRYDTICPPRNAWEVHRRLPGSTLVLADAAAHSMTEPAIARALLGFFRELEPR